MKKSILQRIIPFDDLKETVFRFPLSVLCALGIFVISIALVHDFIDDPDEWLGRVIAILGCCYLWFGISKIMAQSQGWGRVKYLVISFVVAGGIAALVLLSSLWWMSLIFVLPALLLTLMVAPYLTGGDDISVWFFNRLTWFGVVVSYAALIMFAGGLSIALGAVEALFDVDIDKEVYLDIWLFAALVLGPLYALSWVPKTFEYSDDDCSDPIGLKFIVNWISAPIVFVYLLILYAYFIKITMTGELPNGHLAYMITGFAGVGIITYLLAWPLRNEGSLQLKLFYKIFFPALLIPVGFHFYAIWERISAYGVTEQRYLLLISAVWFLLISVSNSISKIPIKAIPASLAILMIFASFGPWGGVSVSGQSQFSRLETLLTKHDLLVDGKAVKTEATIPFEDRKSISSIIDYICKSNRDAMVEPWFNTEGKEKWKCSSGRTLTKQLGFDYVRYSKKPVDSNSFKISAKNGLRDVKGYHYFLENKYLASKRKKQKPSATFDDGRELYLSLNELGVVELKIQDDIIFEYDIDEFVAKNIDYQDSSKPLYLDIDNDKIAARLYFSYIRGKMEEEKPIINNMSFDFAFRFKE